MRRPKAERLLTALYRTFESKWLAGLENLMRMQPMNDGVGGSNPFTSGFLSIVHSSGIEFLLRRPDPRSEPISITGPVSGLYNLTSGRRSHTAAPLSRIRRARAQENGTKLKIGIQRPKGFPVRSPGSVRTDQALRIRIFVSQAFPTSGGFHDRTFDHDARAHILPQSYEQLARKRHDHRRL